MSWVARSLYLWMHDPSVIEHFWGKNFWLQPRFMVIRDVVALLLILGGAFWLLRQSTHRDAFLSRAKMPPRAMPQLQRNDACAPTAHRR